MDTKELFKVLIKSYYDKNFEETVNDLLEKNKEQKEYLSKLIASLSGTELDMNENFAKNLQNAILNYSQNHKVVIKIRDCAMDCAVLGTKTKCQKACPFEAILVNEEKHTTFIDNEKCTDCGFCIEACPNSNYIDKVEFIPMMKLL